MLRIAVLARAVHPLHGVGGLERHVYDLVRHLLARNTAITLITQPPSRAATGDVISHNGALTVRYVPYKTFPFAGRRGTTVIDRSTAYPWFGERAGRLAAALAERGSIDLVHGLGASAFGFARRRKANSVPFVFNPQGLEEFGSTDPRGARWKPLFYKPLQAAVRVCANAADRVIATDQSLVATVRKHLRVSADRVRVVPNAIDLDDCDALAGPDAGRALRQKLQIGSDERLLLSAGRIEENKGFESLAAALGALKTRLDPPSWRWILVGDGPYRPALERAIDRHGIGSHVMLTGRLSDSELHAWYEAATLFLHPTLYEGSSLVTLEAMSHSRPVVATQAGGLPDKVKAGINGWLVPPGDRQALSAAIEEALSNQQRLDEFGKQSRLIVEQEFSWKSAVSRLLDVYSELMDLGLAASSTHRQPF